MIAVQNCIDIDTKVYNKLKLPTIEANNFLAMPSSGNKVRALSANAGSRLGVSIPRDRSSASARSTAVTDYSSNSKKPCLMSQHMEKLRLTEAAKKLNYEQDVIS